MTMANEPRPAEPRATWLFSSRVHKSALGAAIGLVTGCGVFALTVVHLVLHPADGLKLVLLAQYFYGYDVSWRGAVIGGLWGFAAGFVVGWFGALVRNVTVATLLFALRTKAELTQTADFLDHIG
jgi:hypothetical protein